MTTNTTTTAACPKCGQSADLANSALALTPIVRCKCGQLFAVRGALWAGDKYVISKVERRVCVS